MNNSQSKEEKIEYLQKVINLHLKALSEAEFTASYHSNQIKGLRKKLKELRESEE